MNSGVSYGILLAGGLGTRMGKCTLVTNKHLMPIYNRPMIDYSLRTLKQFGVTKVLIVTGDKSASDIMKYVKDGSGHGFESVYYVTQIGNGGIADAIRLGRNFTNDDPFCVMLGDNIISTDFTLVDPNKMSDFIKDEKSGLVCFKKVDDNSRFGVPTFDKSGKLMYIIEKPHDPESKYAQIGLYFYHSNVYDFIEQLSVSQRGELEVTDLNNMYLMNGLLKYCEIDESVFWSDAGNNETLLRCGNYVAEHGERFE